MDGHVGPGAKCSLSCCCLAYGSYPLIKSLFGTTHCFQKGEPGAEWKRFVALWLLLTENHKGSCRSKQPETVLEHFPALPFECYTFNFICRDVKYHFLCELTDELSCPGAGWVLVTPQIMTKNHNQVKYCTYSESEMRTCPYMVAWGGATTPVHPGDDGAGGPARRWVVGWWSFGLLR